MDLVTEGIHTVRARTWTFKRHKDKDRGFYLTIHYVTEGGPPGLEAGRVVGTLFFNPREEQTSLRVLRELGWEGDRPEECHDNGGGLDRHPIRVVVAHKTYNDRTHAVVERVVFPDEEMRRELSEFFEGMRVLPTKGPTRPEPSGGRSPNTL